MQVTTQNITIPKLRFKEFRNRLSVLNLNDILSLLTDFEANGSFADVKSNVTVFDDKNYAWYVRATDLENNTSLKNVKYVDEHSYNFLKKTPLFGNELLITKRGEIGKVYFFEPKEKIRATVAPNMYLLNLNCNTESKYIYYYFKNNNGNKKLKRINASSTIGALYKDDVKSIKITLPTLPEQEKIASFLSAVDERIQKLERKKSLLEDYKKGVMRQLFSQEIRFKDENGNNYPDWEEKKLNEITWFQEGPGVRRSQYTKSGVKLLNVGNLELNKLNLPKTDKYISDEQANGAYKHFLIDDGDVLIACSGVSFHSYSSKICVAERKHLPLCLNTSTMRFKALELLDAKFLFQFLRSFSFKKQVFRVLSGSAQFNFGPTHIKFFKLRTPSLKEQQKIASFLSGIDKKIELVETQIQQSKTFKKGLLQQMFV